MNQSTLSGWLGCHDSDTPKKKTVRELSPPRPTAPERLVLGVIGTRSNIRYEEFERDIVGPLMEAWGVPDAIVASAEGDIAELLTTWATHNEVPLRLISADWVRQGKRAGMLRDGSIQRDASHLVFLQGPRSNTMMTLALRLSRKGRPVVISQRPGIAVMNPADVESTTAPVDTPISTRKLATSKKSVRPL